MATLVSRIGYMLRRRTTREPSPFETRILDGLGNHLPGAALSICAVVFVALSLSAMLGESSTMDEGVHLSAGYTHLVFQDFRMSPETAPLAKTLSAVPLLFLPVRLPSEPSLWKDAEHGLYGFHFLYHSGNNAEHVLFWGRAITLFWSLLLLGSVYAAVREHAHPSGALVALVLATFSPMLLGHGHLVTQDVPVAALFFLTVVAFGRALERPSARWILYSGILLGGALTTKFSAVLLVPILAVLAFVHRVRSARARGRSVAPDPSSGDSPGRRLLPLWAMVALVLLLAVGTVWAVYGFRFAGSPDPEYRYSWEFPASGQALPARVLHRLARLKLLPEAFLYGLQWQNEHNARGHPAYAVGTYSQRGWWWYFPFAYLVKEPIGAQMLVGWGIYHLLRRSTRKASFRDGILVSIGALWLFGITASINIGLRYMLPCYPFLFFAAGSLEEFQAGAGTSWLRRRLAALLIGCAVLAGILSTPYFLASFNLPARLLVRRHFLLVDSNMDWGQDLGRLKKWMDREGVRELKLAYFGFASPERLGLSHQVLPADNPYSRVERRWKRADDLRPGDYVAVSATAFVGVLSSDRTFYLRQLRGLRPVTTIGHTILVYRIPESGRSP